MITLTLPPHITPDDSQHLSRAIMTGGPDGMPYLTQARVERGELQITRDLEESGYLAVPWRIPGAGRLLVTTATLVERQSPYDLVVELARGKLNHLRNQTADWLLGGLNLPPTVSRQIREAAAAFCRALARQPSAEAREEAVQCLALAHEAADGLIQAYTAQVFQVRRQRQAGRPGAAAGDRPGRLDTVLGCRLGPVVPEGAAGAALLGAVNGISVPFAIHEIAVDEGEYDWQHHDRFVDWARGQGVALWGGPFLDFSPARIPNWMWLWERDRGRLAAALCEYTSEVIGRYKGHITAWQLTTGGNCPGGLSLQGDELLWLTLQMGEAARRADPKAELVVGIGQPWGDYLGRTDQAYSPLVYVDTLLRHGLTLAAVDLEVVMGVGPRGSYCRDLLEFSRLLDMYAMLGVPVQVTLAYPAGDGEDLQADAEHSVDLGYWRGPASPRTQAAWAREFAALALCKPYVRSVQWAQFSDAYAHPLPHCGLLDAQGEPQPALDELQALREEYLR